MKRKTRRDVLGATSAAFLGATGGCLATLTGTGTDEPPTDEGPTPDRSLLEWERSTDCDAMTDSVISVQGVTSSVDPGYEPIVYADLPTAEQSIVSAVTDVGGYGTCDASAAFVDFAERARDTRTQQDTYETVYLERDGVFYALSVEHNDQVYV